MPSPGWGRTGRRRRRGRPRRRRRGAAATPCPWAGTPPAMAACQIRVPASSTGAAMGRRRKGSNVSRTRRPDGQGAVEGAGGGQADRAEHARHDDHPRHLDAGPVEEDDSDGQEDLEDDQLDGDGDGLAQVEPGRVDARQAEAVSGAVGRLHRHAALDGQHRAEQDGDPEQARGALGHHLAVRAEGEGEEDQGHDPERGDLGQRHPGAPLDAEVLAGHEHGVTPHGPPVRPWAPPSPWPRSAGAAGDRPAERRPAALGRHPSTGHGHGPEARSSTGPGLVAGDEHGDPGGRGLERPTWSSRSPRRRRRGRHGARRATTARATGRSARPARPGAAGRRTACRPRSWPGGPTSPQRSQAGSIRATSPPAARTAKRTFSRTVRSS